MKTIAVSLLALGFLVACSPPPAAPQSTSAAPVEGLPAGTYRTDPTHSTLVFTVDHLGFSNYTAAFTAFDATLDLDPANPAAAKLTATVRPRSLQLPSPPEGFYEELTGPKWLESKAFPEIRYVSTRIEMTGATTAKVTGDLTLRGMTRPVSMDVTFNGGYPGLAGMDPQARIGFSATGVLTRSDFGIDYGVPAPGSTMGVSDEVRFTIETEMLGPPLKS